jgi:hypothetical protein
LYTVDNIIEVDAVFTDFVVPPPLYNANQTGFALTKSPVGFQVIYLKDGAMGPYVDIQQDRDVSIDAYVYSPATSIFTFLIRSIDGAGYGRIAAYQSYGEALWTLSNAADDDVDDNNPDTRLLSGWTWDADVVTPILSLDNSTVYINFLSEVVALAAFNLTTGDILWSISSLNDYSVVMGESTVEIAPDAALGGMLLAETSIYAGIYDRYVANHTGATSTFNSGFLHIHTENGTVNTNNSWVYDGPYCLGSYQGGIRGTPAWGTSNVYASDQFWGMLAWSQRNLTNLVYNTHLQNEYTPSALVMSDDKSVLFGLRDGIYPTGYIPQSGFVKWTTKTIRLQCDTMSVSRNPPPVVEGNVVYYSCGNVWYGFLVNNGTLYNYGNATTIYSNHQQGLFVSLSVVDGVVYTTENFVGMTLSYITAWDTLPTNAVEEPSQAPTTSSTDTATIDSTASPSSSTTTTIVICCCPWRWHPALLLAAVVAIGALVGMT